MPPYFSHLATVLLFSPVVLAAETVTTHPCAAIREPADRLACYDASFPASASETMARPPGEDVGDPTRRDFGLNPAQLRELPNRAATVSSPKQIDATVVAVTEGAAGTRVVTLEDGQVWVITESRSKGRVRSGDRVQIRKAALGSFKLVTAAGVALRVRRVR